MVSHETKMILAVSLVVIIATFFMGLIMMFLSNHSATYTCEKYDSYGFVTEIDKSKFYEHICYIIMEDGIRIKSYDFELTSYVQPKRR